MTEEIKTSVQLAEYIDSKDVDIGPQNIPGREINYKRLDGDEPGKAMAAKYIKGNIPEESRQLLSKLKAGDKFVVVKQLDGKWWNLKEFRDGSTWVDKPVKKPWTGGGGGKSFEKKDYDQTGVKVGAARNQAIAFLAATKGNNFTLDDVDSTAYDIVKRQQAQEDNVRSGGPTRVLQEVQLSNEQHNRDLDDDIDF